MYRSFSLRRLLGVVLAGLLALAPVSAASAEPGQDTVVGSGQWETSAGERVFVSVGARSGPLGEDPDGVITVRWENNVEGVAEVTCVAVAGNFAQVWGKFKKPIPYFGGPATWQIVWLLVTDGGNPGEQGDRFNVGFFRSLAELPPVTACAASYGGYDQSERGNFTVHDAAP